MESYLKLTLPMIYKGDYIHIKSKARYYVSGEGMMQIDGKWIPCVIYKNARFEVYVREAEDFKIKFKKECS